MTNKTLEERIEKAFRWLKQEKEPRVRTEREKAEDAERLRHIHEKWGEALQRMADGPEAKE